MFPNKHIHTKRLQKTPKFVKYCISLCKDLLDCGRDFCLETSIHGLNHIAAANRYWIERLLWVLVIAAAVWGATSISLGQLQRYNENPTVVTLEKDFRSWLYSLPGITYCDVDRYDATKVPTVIKRYWNISPDEDGYEYFNNFIITVANSDLYNLTGFNQFKDDQKLNIDLYKLALEVMPAQQVKATWSMGINAKWTPTMTERGICFVTNTVTIADAAIIKPTINDTAMFPITCKYSSLSCFVILEVIHRADFYTHSPYDLADMTQTPSHNFLTLNRITDLSVMETRCGRGVRDLKPQRRGCRFTDEPQEAGRQVYSTNTCRRSCRNRLAIQLCGCKPFYNFYEDGVPCSSRGVACLAEHRLELAKIGDGRCTCAPQCVDAVYRESGNVDQIWAKGPFANRGAIKYVLQTPRTRYTREIVFYFQDLVVSFGGAAGLFLGASFISFVEIPYFFLDRIIRLFVRQQDKEDTSPKNVADVTYEEQRIADLTSIINEQTSHLEDIRNNKTVMIIHHRL